MEYWFKVLQFQIWSENTKPFFCESEANLETIEKRSAYILVSCKFVLKSVKRLNQTTRAIKYWFKAL